MSGEVKQNSVTEQVQGVFSKVVGEVESAGMWGTIISALNMFDTDICETILKSV